jgi:hypothetical protein
MPYVWVLSMDVWSIVHFEGITPMDMSFSGKNVRNGGQISSYKTIVSNGVKRLVLKIHNR